MADKVKEQLSAMADDECAKPELVLALRRLAKDNELKSCWQRYHLISDTLRNNLPQSISLDPDFSTRVHDLIAAEPPLQQAAVQRFRWSKPVIGFATAASFAAVIGIGWWNYQQSALDTSVMATIPPTSQPIAGSAPGLTESESTAIEERLQDYVVSHNEYASVNSVHGILPYMRRVSFNDK